MFISRKAYQDLRDDLVKAQATAQAEVIANRALKETLNWLMLRVTALEKERAAMLHTFYGVKIAVPEISIAPKAVEDPFANHPLNESFSFRDIGDEEALKQGISHDSEGNVVYA